MKKKILLSLACAMLFTMTTSSIYANRSSTLTSPAFKLNSWTHGRTINMKTDMDETAMGSHAGFSVYYNESFIGKLEQEFVADSNRGFEIHLKDKDGFNNADDILKKYQGKFQGRLLVGMRLVTTNDVVVDEKGDNQAELYIAGYLKKNPKDIGKSSVLFQYQLSMS